MRVSKAFYRRVTGKRAPAGPPTVNQWEAMLASQLEKAGIQFEGQVEFHGARNWRADFKIGSRILLDIDGGVHRIRDKFARDVERHNAIVLAGWLYLRVTPGMVKDGRAIELVRTASYGCNRTTAGRR